MTYMNHYEILTSQLFFFSTFQLWHWKMQTHTKLFLMEEVLVLWPFSPLFLNYEEKQMKKEKQIMPKQIIPRLALVWGICHTFFQDPLTGLL